MSAAAAKGGRAADALRAGGLLVFTVESLPDAATAPYRINLSGRYAHTAAHVREALQGAGFRGDAAVAAVALRKEAGADVAGWLVGAHRDALAPV
ncbi:hypothetical protein [uncultured Pseudacidovorax sp.]|uniref:hypothetical protein n=1 Tax=uncultured Pseudacidovorax sp. TaxID=679313 RepID=UPI0025FCDC56|nr:hypothetical protein [uncultured Pseudacidovorax sp.]